MLIQKFYYDKDNNNIQWLDNNHDLCYVPLPSSSGLVNVELESCNVEQYDLDEEDLEKYNNTIDLLRENS